MEQVRLSRLVMLIVVFLAVLTCLSTFSFAEESSPQFVLHVPEGAINETLVTLKGADNGTLLLDNQHENTLKDPAAAAEANKLVDEFDTGGIRTVLHALGRNDVERLLVQFNKSCNLSELPSQIIRQDIETDKYRFIVLLVPRLMLTTLVQNDCVLKVADAVDQENFLTYAHRVLEEERREQALRLNLQGSSSDLSSYKDVLDGLENEWDKAHGAYSPLQQYVTPKDPRVVSLAERKNDSALYSTALTWPWVSDPTLWKEEDDWLKPDSFLSTTPGEATNPFSGEPVSDCEEHANTLVSLLRADGVSPKDVRVAIGEVKFEDGTTGGHAWAELRLDGAWIVLDSTVGDYYDDHENTTVQRDGLPFSYWKYHEFPIKEVWAYYNDDYFLDLRQGHAPTSWNAEAGTLLDKELRQSMKGSLWERFLLFIGRIVGKLF